MPFPIFWPPMLPAPTGYDDALLHCDGHFSECTSSNFFLVRNGHLFTPPLSSACLDGVMRKQVIRLAKENAIPISETPLNRQDLTHATEAFVTNSIGGIRPILALHLPEKQTPPLFSATGMGPITYTLHAALLSECE